MRKEYFIHVLAFLLFTGCGFSAAPNCDYSGGNSSIDRTFSARYTKGYIFHPEVMISIISRSSDTMRLHLDSTKQDTTIMYLNSRYIGVATLNLDFFGGEKILDSIDVMDFKHNTLYIGEDPNIRSMRETKCKNIYDSKSTLVATFCTTDPCQ